MSNLSDWWTALLIMGWRSSTIDGHAELLRRFAALEAERDEAVDIISELSGQNCEVINDTKCYCDWHVPAAGISCGRCRAISWHKANVELMQKWAVKAGELANRTAQPPTAKEKADE
jgi:hypothetical protein